MSFRGALRRRSGQAPRRSNLLIATKNTAGVSLIIAIIFVSAFLLVIAGLAEVQIRTIRNIANRESEAKARYLAESAQELANYWVTTKGVGANSEDDANGIGLLKGALYVVAQGMGITNCVSTNCVPDFKIQSRAGAGDTFSLSFGTALPQTYYSVPIRRTGSVAKECQVDVPTALAAVTDMDKANDACNWNKIGVGETVEVPLYYDDQTGTPSWGSGSFILRVRTPCEDYENGTTNCTSGERIELYPKVGDPAYRNRDKDKVLIQWLISSKDGGKTMVAGDKTVVVQNGSLRVDLSDTRDGSKNTEISAGRIDDAVDNSSGSLDGFLVLNSDQKGKDLAQSDPQSINSFLQNVSNPILRLSLVDQPKRQAPPSLNVPFLEYQLLTTNAISDTKSSLSGTIQIGDFKKEFSASQKHEPTLGGFALESF